MQWIDCYSIGKISSAMAQFTASNTGHTAHHQSVAAINQLGVIEFQIF